MISPVGEEAVVKVAFVWQREESAELGFNVLARKGLPVDDVRLLASRVSMFGPHDESMCTFSGER